MIKKLINKFKYWIGKFKSEDIEFIEEPIFKDRDYNIYNIKRYRILQVGLILGKSIINNYYIIKPVRIKCYFPSLDFTPESYNKIYKDCKMSEEMFRNLMDAPEETISKRDNECSNDRLWEIYYLNYKKNYDKIYGITYM